MKTVNECLFYGSCFDSLGISFGLINIQTS